MTCKLACFRNVPARLFPLIILPEIISWIRGEGKPFSRGFPKTSVFGKATLEFAVLQG
jgi:hypothetical protein